MKNLNTLTCASQTLRTTQDDNTPSSPFFIGIVIQNVSEERTLMKKIFQGVSEANDNMDGNLNKLSSIVEKFASYNQWS